MTTITAHSPSATLINVFTVEPDNSRELVEVLSAATDAVMQHLPGFISANIHLSTDGTRVANYAQWASMADFQAMQQNPAAHEHMVAAAELATSFEPHFYTVESVHAK
jgi:heme-degrading monooxygenase HmoA